MQAQTVKYLATGNAIRAVEIGLQLIGNPGLSKKIRLKDIIEMFFVAVSIHPKMM
ncbi:MAG: hypothetical protein NHB32_16325 [Fischerella sp. CENA71]|nr:hypothetical protein [Fischerella sp. CENA71]